MSRLIFRHSFIRFFLGFLIVLAGCKKDNPTDDQGNYDIDAKGIPKFVSTDYIEAAKIDRISKFRSAEGHNYSDDFESCRSMKHYFNPKADVDWATIRIFSPVKGTIVRIDEEWAGTQLRIHSEQYPAFYFIIFHILMTNPLKLGDAVSEGQQLGTHIGSQTYSDMAVGVSTPNGWKLISYFDVMTDQLFQDYQARGIGSRSDLIITKELRDADQLNCTGETFGTTGTLDNWINLN